MEQITCDLIPGGKMPLLHASQYDEGREYRINLTENKQAYTLDGTELLTVSVRKGDNTLFTADIANTFGGKNYVDFVSTEQMCACAGFSFGELSITKNNTRIGTINFTLMVEPSPEEGGVSQSEINNLARQVEELVDEDMGDYLLKTEAEETYATITALETLSGVVDTKASASDLETLEGVVDTKASKTYVDTELDKKADASSLAEVATSGSYNDLTDKPTIPEQVQSDWNEADNTKPDYIKNKPNLSTVATTGNYDDLNNKPTIPVIDDTTEVNNKVWSSKKTFDEIVNILPTGTASGSIANFKTSLALPMEIEAEFGADVGGVSAVNVSHCGTNLVDLNITKPSWYSNQWLGTSLNDNHGIRQTRTNAQGGYGGFQTFLKAGTYTVSASVEDETLEYDGGMYYTPDGITSSSIWFGILNKTGKIIYRTFTLSKDSVVAFRISCSAFSSGVSYVDINNIQLEVGNTYSDFVIPNKTVEILQFGGTYYNGGKVTIDKDGHRTLTAEGETVALLDGEPITALVGTNNVYADSGNSEVVYKKSIDDAIAELQALILS